MKVITKNYKRRIVIADVHGCLVSLKKIFEYWQPDKSDAVFFLGDYVDRGPDSAGVIDFISRLKKNGLNIFLLMGNHEYALLYLINNFSLEKRLRYVSEKNSLALFDENVNLKPVYKQFFSELDYFFELEDFFLVHAGFDLTKHDFLTDKEAMMKIRDWTADLNKTHGKIVIHGHHPEDIRLIRRAIQMRSSRIPLDNGCTFLHGYRRRPWIDLGRLCSLELNTFRLFCVQAKDDLSNML